MILQNKKAQVTIFIIIGIILISIGGLFLLFRSDIIPEGWGGRETNPDSFLESCLEDKIKEAVGIISSRGGYINNPLHKTFEFADESNPYNISYLCYTQNYDVPCGNQEPMLIQHLKDEIHNYISNDVDTCFTELENSLYDQGYTVDATSPEFGVELKPKKIIIEIDAEMTLTKTEESLRYENFTITVASMFYDLAIVAYEIVRQEAKPCSIFVSFDHLGFTLLYPQWEIDNPLTENETRIYRIKHEDSEEKFRFAIRGCVIPPGF